MSAEDDQDRPSRFDAERALLDMARSTGLIDPGGHEDPALLARARQIIGSLPDDHLGSLLQRLAGSAPPALDATSAFCARHAISEAERSLLESVVEGRSVTEHAEAKDISVNTARTHMRRLLEKTGARNQVDLIRIFFVRTPD